MLWLELQHISKSFENVSVLSDISLQAQQGEFVVLLGPSGCGKSTLLRIIAGLEQQTHGTVFIEGHVMDQVSPKDRDIAMVFQNYALYPHLTVRENLAFGLKMRKEDQRVIQSRIGEAADLLEIKNLLGRYPKELSGGQRQRVAMGRAIVRKPKLFLFDEPLSNLDARLRASLRVELKKLHQRLQSTMVYVTHDQVEALTLGEKILILHEGKVQQIGSPRQIYDQPTNTFVAGFIGNPPMNLLSGQIHMAGTTMGFQADGLTIPIPHISNFPENSKMTLGFRPEDVYVETPPSPNVSLGAEIEFIENLGADALVYAKLGDQRFIARVPTNFSHSSGECVTLYIPENRLHVFVNGERVEH